MPSIDGHCRAEASDCSCCLSLASRAMRASAVLATVLSVAAVLLAAPVAAEVFAARDPGYTCLVSVLPALDATIDPSAPVEGRISLLPLGLECRFTATSGIEVVVEPGWLLTGLALAAAVCLLGGIGSALGGFMRRRTSQRGKRGIA